MDRFVETILLKITRQGFNLSIVKNTDGFLSRVDTQEVFIKEAGVTLLPGSPLALRIHSNGGIKAVENVSVISSTA